MIKALLSVQTPHDWPLVAAVALLCLQGVQAAVFLYARGQIKRSELALKAACAEAEAAAAVKSEFLANMSHELRTPLTSIIGFTDLAAGQSDMGETTRGYVERVREASQALLCTVNDILDFSKLERGQVAVEPRPTDLHKLCRSTLDLFAPEAGAKDIALVLDADGLKGAAAMVDPDRVRQILLNLIGNAVKFTPTGSVTLKGAYAPDQGVLMVEVIDTGPGVPPDRIDRLFRRFSQVDGSLTRTHRGAGLGLAICKGLVEAMGGEIGFETGSGGSRFRFAIPARPTAAVEEAAETAETVSLAGARVLVVDDHPANREIARLFLTGMGAEVSEARDGEEAVTRASEWPFDLILMDVRMPRLDGPGALARIRGAPGPNDYTPILAFTAAADVVGDGELRRLGFDGVVAKPICAEAFRTAAAAALAVSVATGSRHVA